MAEKTHRKKPASGHRGDQITSYLSETLTPEERGDLEAHLDTCEECQTELEAQEALFSEVNEVLAARPKGSIDEQVARFEKIVAAERAAHRRGKRWWPLAALAAVVTALVAVAVIAWHGAPTRPEQTQGAPAKQ